MNHNKVTFFRDDKEEETVDDETIEEVSTDDINGAPAIIFEQQELPRSLGNYL